LFCSLFCICRWMLGPVLWTLFAQVES
jgi:hypothetical protein